MERNKLLSYINYFMKSLNLFIIVCISLIMARTTYLISNSNNAREFLEQIPALPGKPEYTVIISISTYIILWLVMEFKEKIYDRKLCTMIFFYFIEFLLCTVLLITLNMSYNGILLVVIADIIYHIKYKNNRLIFLSIMIVIYIYYVIMNLYLLNLILYLFKNILFTIT